MDFTSIKILIATSLILPAPAYCEAAKKGDTAPFLVASVNHDKAVEGERLIYEVTLYTPDPAVAGIELVAEPDFSGFPAMRSAADMRLRETEIKGKKYYTVVIDRFFVGADKKGSHSLKGGAYMIGFDRRVRVNDPFWGPQYASRVEVEEVNAPDISVNVRSLPQRGRPSNFSGAVGNFEVVAHLPQGDIIAGEEAYLMLTVSGEGDLSQVSPPDVRSAFGEGLRFKSMSENHSEYISGGGIGSELEMECVFVPAKEGSWTISGVTFTYFNPRTGKYETAASAPVTVEVKGRSSSDSESPSIFMDI